MECYLTLQIKKKVAYLPKYKKNKIIKKVLHNKKKRNFMKKGGRELIKTKFKT